VRLFKCLSLINRKWNDNFVIPVEGMELSPLLPRPLNGLLYQPWMMIEDDDECIAVGRMLCRGNWSTLRKPAPVLICPPHILPDLIRAQTWATMVRSQPLTAWAIAQPWQPFIVFGIFLYILNSNSRWEILTKCRTIWRYHYANIFMKHYYVETYNSKEETSKTVSDIFHVLAGYINRNLWQPHINELHN
jgi:hypothetical protein